MTPRGKSVAALSRAGAKEANAFQKCIGPGCGREHDLNERVYVCAECGASLEISVPKPALKDAAGLRDLWESRRRSLDSLDRSGVWRFRELLPFAGAAPVVTLLEGNTPLYDAPRSAAYSKLDSLRLKHQGCNPTGSFKDTGMTAAVTQAVVLRARTVVCASTGNTAASLAAYAARAGLRSAILLPHGQISSSKLAQSVDYGAAVREIDGNFDDCMKLIRELGGDPSIYVANSINPFRIEGQKTVAFELIEQCAWRVPDHVVVPGGNLGNSSALGKGFSELLQLGLIRRLPRLSVIQAEGAAPLAHLFASLAAGGRAMKENLPEEIMPVANPKTLATAIKIGSPVSWKKALRSILESGGSVITVSEQEIADAKAVIGRDGIGCEPASATTVAGIRRLAVAGLIRPHDDVVAVLTGHILKDPDYVSHYHRGTLASEAGGPPISGAFRNQPQRVAATKEAVLRSLEGLE
ncbi:MAG TPA: threonine synthase [Verrucomicrobiae bacterium]|nr:threonine synthase [Verrucomicrobiae bacterium]